MKTDEVKKMGMTIINYKEKIVEIKLSHVKCLKKYQHSSHLLNSSYYLFCILGNLLKGNKMYSSCQKSNQIKEFIQNNKTHTHLRGLV